MPATTVDDTLVLPRIPRPDPAASTPRPADPRTDRLLRPFRMNTREEILQAIEDYEAGRLGIIPADQLAPRNYA
jgi:hypothetical protein